MLSLLFLSGGGGTVGRARGGSGGGQATGRPRAAAAAVGSGRAVRSLLGYEGVPGRKAASVTTGAGERAVRALLPCFVSLETQVP